MARKRVAKAPGWGSDPQYLAFEADIIAQPDDDAPRLILADWLEDHGDEHTAARAEFIRLQSELAACPHFAKLRGLSLPSSSIGDDKLAELLGKANLENVEVLELPSANVSRQALAAITGGSFPRLRELDLSGNYLRGHLAAL